jgi:hypothetical protein
MRTESVERAMAGDHIAFAELVDLEGDSCYSIAVGILSVRDIRTRWPSLGGFDLTGASFCATDGFLDQHRLVRGSSKVSLSGAAVDRHTPGRNGFRSS